MAFGTPTARFDIRATNSTGKAFREVDNSIGALAGKFSRGLGAGLSLGAQAGKFSRELGAGLSFAGITAGIKSLVDGAEDIGNQARAVGQSTDAFQAFANSVRNTGGTAEQTTGALFTLHKSVDEATSGNQSAINAFAGLGITLDELSGASMPKVLDMVAKGFKETNSFSDAAKILGSGNLKNVNLSLLEIADQGLPAFVDQAKKAGTIFDEAFIARAERANDILFKFGLQAKVLAAEVLDAYVNGLGTVKAFFSANKDLFTGNLSKNGETFGDAFFRHFKTNTGTADNNPIAAALSPGSRLDAELQDMLARAGTTFGDSIASAWKDPDAALRAAGLSPGDLRTDPSAAGTSISSSTISPAELVRHAQQGADRTAELARKQRETMVGHLAAIATNTATVPAIF